jgi:hypothetical protein
MSTSRKVTDAEGRVWACRQDDSSHNTVVAAAPAPGQDVSIMCTTASVSIPLRITVGWQWMTMSDNGLARLIADAAPQPARQGNR